LALAFRGFDSLFAEDVAFRLVRAILSSVHGLEAFTDRKVLNNEMQAHEHWLISGHVVPLLLALAVAAVAPLTRWLYRDHAESDEPKGRVYRLAHALTWPTLFLSAALWGITWLDWPTRQQTFDVPVGLRDRLGLAPADYRVRPISWGDGSGVPASGKGLIFVGRDDKKFLHIRAFDDNDNRVINGSEKPLPYAPGRLEVPLPDVEPVATLKGAPEVLSPPETLPPSEQEKTLKAAALSAIEAADLVNIRFCLALADRFTRTAGSPMAAAAQKSDEVGTRAGIFLGLLSGEPRRTRWALTHLDQLRPRYDPNLPPFFDVLKTDEEVVKVPGGAVRAAYRSFWKSAREYPREYWPARRGRSPWGESDDQLAAVLSGEERYTTPLASADAARLYDTLVHTRLVEISALIVTDLLRAMLPAILSAFVFCGLWVTGSVFRGLNARLRSSRIFFARFSWILLGAGIVISLVNGDTDIGFFKFLIPSLPGVEPIIDEETGVMSGARVTLSGTLAMVRSLVFTVPTMVAAVLALIPVVSGRRFLESAEQPKDSLQGKFFRFVVGSVVIVLPLAAFAFLVRENVSGAAPWRVAEKVVTKDAEPRREAGKEAEPARDVAKAAATTPEAAPKRERNIARLAFCPDSRFLPREYLIANDQRARLLIFLASGLTFLFLALTVDLNRTSIHTFYRDRLSETFLGGCPGKPPAVRTVAALDGTRVGFPYHIIATTLNQFHRADDPEDNQHAFILSRLYCGSDVTGYRRTDRYKEGVDLGDAVAISGAAISPIQARSLPARLIMLILNMRLGQWYPNPNPACDLGCRMGPWRIKSPRLLRLLYEHTFRAKPPRVSRQHREAQQSQMDTRAFCFLSDGAHFDNLGFWLLLQRRCRLIILSDVSYDPTYNCEDVITILRKERARQGLTFEPIPMEKVREHLGIASRAKVNAEPDPRSAPFRFRPDDTELRKQIKLREVGENFLVGRIGYPPDPDDPQANREGLLILIKPSLTAELVDRPEIYQYLQINPEYPHDADVQQVYDEARVEAYRQLGQCVGEAFAAAICPNRDCDISDRDGLMDVVDRLLNPKTIKPSDEPESPWDGRLADHHKEENGAAEDGDLARSIAEPEGQT
jgi:hypothetical protein